jgi:hypothetical protein
MEVRSSEELCKSVRTSGLDTLAKSIRERQDHDRPLPLGEWRKRVHITTKGLGPSYDRGPAASASGRGWTGLAGLAGVGIQSKVETQVETTMLLFCHLTKNSYGVI